MKYIANSILTIFFLIVSANLAFAEIIVESSTPSSMTVLYKPELQSAINITIDNEAFADLIFTDAGNILSEIGYPQIPAATRSIAIPSPSGFKITNVEVGAIRKINQRIAPVHIFGNEDKTTIDERAYKNRPLEDWATIEYAGISRDKHIAKLNLIAAKYNPFSNATEIPQYIRVTIQFDNKNSSTNPSKKISQFDKSLLNSNVASMWKVSDNEIFFKNSIEKYSKQNQIQKQEVLSSGSWYKVNISETGVYELTAEYLKSNGINIPNDQINTIKMFGNGGQELPRNVDFAQLNTLNQQAITVNKNNDGSLKSIVFFGSGTSGFEYDGNEYFYTGKKVIHYINHFTNSVNYLLTWGGEEGLRATPTPVSSNPVVNNMENFTRRQFFEEELINGFHSGSGVQYFGRSYWSDPFEMNLINLDENGTVKYEFMLAHSNIVYQSGGQYDGFYSIAENGKSIASNLRIEAKNAEYFRKNFTISIPASDLPNKSKSVLKLNYDNPNWSPAVGVFDYYEIHYPSKLIAHNEEIYLFTDPELEGTTRYNFTGFTGEIYAYDITNIAAPIRLESNGQNNFNLITDLQKQDPKRFFISSNPKQVNKVENITFANLRDNKFNNDVILVTNKKLKESAKKYKEYREANSDLSVGIFYLDEIYNEYSAGNMDITAIRDFVSQAMINWDNKPSYLILWGDGHFDYRNILTEKENLVPPHESEDNYSTFDFINSTSTDDYYARVIGNDNMIDLAVGRIPISTEEQGENVVEKIRHYENNSDLSDWRTKISLVADDGFSGTENGNDDGDGARFVIDSEGLELSRIPDFMQTDKIYTVEYQTQYTAAGNRKPGANADLLKTVNEQGVLLLNWYGHGNPQVWSHESILDRDVTIQQMINKDRLFFLTAATCDFAKFDNYDSESGAETMLLSPYGGSIGSFAASRVGFASQNHTINKAFYSELFTLNDDNTYPTLGETMFHLKQTLNGQNDEKYFLIGDPTVRLLIPSFDIIFDEINDIVVTDSTDITVKGLQTVTVKGHIAKQGNPLEKATDFNGNIKIKVVDGDVLVKIYDSINRLYEFDKEGGTLSNANFEVVNGEFTSEFILPKDISFSDNYGKIYGFAYTNDNKFAKGNYNTLKIDGITSTSSNDKDGPKIDIYLDSRKFKAGDIVRNEPLLLVDLQDATGINSTGIGVGHKIEAWIDQNEQSIDLTSDYESSFEDYRKGTASKVLLGLEPGAHTIKVRAWDIFNNYSTGETYFNISQEGDVIVEEVMAFPTPFENNTTISFNHNLNPPLNVQLDIFDARGAKIKTVNDIVLTPYNGEISWDGNDNGGTEVSIGTYYFRLKIDNLNANQTFLKGRTVKIK